MAMQPLFYGDSNKVNANRVMIMGDSATVDHDDSWVINIATSSNVKTTASNQILWVSDYGVSINTNNASEILVADGDLVADYFYGDGSQLTNFSKLDKYWLMFDNLMTISNFKLGVKTSVGDIRQNPNKFIFRPTIGVGWQLLARDLSLREW